MCDPVHEEFLVALRGSYPAVFRFAQWFHKHRDAATYIPPPREAEKHEQWRDYVDDGDLKVYYRGEEVGKRCEVKHYLETDFTSLADFPHKWLFLGNAAAWDRADPKPYIYCVLTRLGTHAAFVPGRAHGSWSRINVTDKRRGTTELTIACPPDVAWWTKL